MLAGLEADRSVPSGMGAAGTGDSRRAELDAALLAAHACRDHAALVALYSQAGDMARAAGDREAMCFYLTHAYVYALETGAPEADILHARLKVEGREE